MSLIKRVLFIFALAFFLRVLISCGCDCSDVVHAFDFLEMDIANADNTQKYYELLASDTMQNEAIAFEITLRGDPRDWMVSCLKKDFSFSSTYAFSCDCSYNLKANQHISDINITTVYDLSNEITAGSYVTPFFYIQDGGYEKGLYITFDELYENINQTIFDGDASYTFLMVFNEPVDCASVQFEIEMVFDDNLILRDKTDVIHLKYNV